CSHLNISTVVPNLLFYLVPKFLIVIRVLVHHIPINKRCNGDRPAEIYWSNRIPDSPGFVINDAAKTCDLNINFLAFSRFSIKSSFKITFLHIQLTPESTYYAFGQIQLLITDQNIYTNPVSGIQYLGTIFRITIF